MMQTGDVIRQLRMRDGMTQQELAEALKVAPASIKKYEGNQVKNLKLSVVQSLCKVFRVTPYAFVFPEAWIGNQMVFRNDPDVYKFTAIYTQLSDEGKQKVLCYMEDLSLTKKYVREDFDQYKDIHELFLYLAGGKRPDQS